MNLFERTVGGRRYRIASQPVWDPVRQRPFARQAVFGPADPPPVAGLCAVRTVGTLQAGGMGALTLVAEQLDLVKLIDQACALTPPKEGPTLGEMVFAVAVQRICPPPAQGRLAAFRETRLPAACFTVQGCRHWAALPVVDLRTGA